MNKNRFNLLGEFQYLVNDGEPREIALAKNIGLVAILVLSKDHSCPRGKIMDLLWSDRCNEQGRASLRHCLWSLKQAFGEDANNLLRADRKRVCLDMENCSSDYADFLQLSESGSPGDLERAVSLYRGELLEGLSIRDREWSDWIGIERENLQSRYLGVLCNLSNFYLADGDADSTIDLGRRMIEYDPLCEDGHRLLMTGYAMMNQRTLALRQFERYRNLIRAEIDSQPGASICHLHEYIKNGVSIGKAEGSEQPPTGLESLEASKPGESFAQSLKPSLVSSF